MKCQKHRRVKHKIILSFSVDWVSNTLDSLKKASVFVNLKTVSRISKLELIIKMFVFVLYALSSSTQQPVKVLFNKYMCW